MTNQSRRSLKIGLLALLAALILALGLFAAIQTGAIDIAEATDTEIQQQGSSPYCLFAATASITGLDMWRLEATYQQRNLPTVDGVIPMARPVIDLAAQLAGKPITIAARWDTGAVQAAVQNRPVVVTGQGHALVLVSWKGGKITYRDSLHPGLQTMTDQQFWVWQDGWAWWVQ